MIHTELWFLYAVRDSFLFQLSRHGVDADVKFIVNYPECKLLVTIWGLELKREFVLEEDGWRPLTNPNSEVVMRIVNGIVEELRLTYNPAYPDLTP